MKSSWKLSVLAAMLAAAHAQAAESTGGNLYPVQIGGYQPVAQGDGTGIPVGPAHLKANVELGVGHDSNVNLSNGTSSPIVSSGFEVVTPQLVLSRTLHGTQHYNAYLRGTYARFNSASAYDYNDTSMGIEAQNAWTAKLLTTLRLDYTLGHDTANSYVATNAIERWHSPTVSAVIHYGTDGSQGQVEVEGDYRQQRYTTDTAIMRTYDLNEARLIGRFIYRLHPRTHALFELAEQRDSYPNNPQSDGTQTRATVGLKWEATAKTTGTVHVGMMHVNMDHGGGGNTGLAWDAKIEYKPVSYSMITLDGSRQYAEWANVANAYVITQGATLAWTHEWTGRIKSTVSLLDYTDNYLGSGRKDDRQALGLKASYAFGHADRYRLGVEEILQNRSSNQSLWNFHENIMMLTLGAAL